MSETLTKRLAAIIFIVIAGCLVLLSLKLQRARDCTDAQGVYWDTYMTCQEQIGKGCEERAEAAKQEYLAKCGESK